MSNRQSLPLSVCIFTMLCSFTLNAFGFFCFALSFGTAFSEGNEHKTIPRSASKLENPDILDDIQVLKNGARDRYEKNENETISKFVSNSENLYILNDIHVLMNASDRSEFGLRRMITVASTISSSTFIKSTTTTNALMCYYGLGSAAQLAPAPSPRQVYRQIRIRCSYSRVLIFRSMAVASLTNDQQYEKREILLHRYVSHLR